MGASLQKWFPGRQENLFPELAGGGRVPRKRIRPDKKGGCEVEQFSIYFSVVDELLQVVPFVLVKPKNDLLADLDRMARAYGALMEERRARAERRQSIVFQYHLASLAEAVMFFPQTWREQLHLPRRAVIGYADARFAAGQAAAATHGIVAWDDTVFVIRLEKLLQDQLFRAKVPPSSEIVKPSPQMTTVGVGYIMDDVSDFLEKVGR